MGKAWWSLAFLGAVTAAALAWVYQASRTTIDDLDFKGKRVIVCGASLGIGRDVAKQYARAGAQVVLVARSVGKLEAIRNELVAEGLSSSSIHLSAVDLGHEQACIDLIHQAAAVMGGIDILILNHIAYAHYGDWLTAKDKAKTIESMFTVNTFSYIWLATEAMDHLAASAGSIVVVSSFAGKVGVPRTPVYSGTKHALHGFFDSLRHELVKTKVPVSITLAVLGSIDTESVQHVKSYIKNVSWALPEEAARAIIRGGALRSREVFFPFVQVWLPSTVFKTFFPAFLDKILQDSMVMPEEESRTAQ